MQREHREVNFIVMFLVPMHGEVFLRPGHTVYNFFFNVESSSTFATLCVTNCIV